MIQAIKELGELKLKKKKEGFSKILFQFLCKIPIKMENILIL